MEDSATYLLDGQPRKGSKITPTPVRKMFCPGHGDNCQQDDGIPGKDRLGKSLFKNCCDRNKHTVDVYRALLYDNHVPKTFVAFLLIC